MTDSINVLDHSVNLLNENKFIACHLTTTFFHVK